MILLFTGAKLFGQPQPSYLKSLGGFLSNSVVPNNSLSNLFSDVSMLGMQKGYSETRAIVLKNTTGVTRTNVYLYHTYPLTDAKAKLEWAFVTIPNSQQMEEINSSESEPYNIGSWQEPIGVGNKVLITSSLANNGVIGLWVKRTLISPDPANSIAAKDLEAYMASQTKQESIVVSIDYT